MLRAGLKFENEMAKLRSQQSLGFLLRCSTRCDQRERGFRLDMTGLVLLVDQFSVPTSDSARLFETLGRAVHVRGRSSMR